MFCVRCGRKIEYNSIVCNECSGKQDFFVEEAPKPIVDKGPRVSRNLGLGRGIAGAVLGYIAIIFSMMGMIYSMLGAFITGLADTAKADFDIVIVGDVFFMVGIAFVLISLIFSIISLSKGVKSVKLFKTSRPRPIATLILGIVSLDYSVASLIFAEMGIIYSFLIMAFLYLPM